MFDEPDESKPKRPLNPTDRAKEKSDEFRMHAELAAIFEGVRKFDAGIYSGLNADLARDTQRTIGRLEKSRMPDTPLLQESVFQDAAALLDLPKTKDLSTNDYHIHRRPGEAMILRWLAGDQVETFYERLQAHFDAALAAHKDDERSTHGWKQDANSQAYVDALDKIELKMAERYLRPIIRQHTLYVLSTQSADEMDILHLADYIMGVPSSEIVGESNAPPDSPTEQDRAWFFKVFSLRGISDEVEKMCFFTYLQKTDQEEI